MLSGLQALLNHPGLGLRTGDRLAEHSPETGARPVDWLTGGAIHEWFYWPDLQAVGQQREGRGGGWYAPLTLLAELVGGHLGQRKGGEARGGAWIVWVGRRCWPGLQLLYATLSAHGVRSLDATLEHCVFLDPLTEEEKLWGICQALRCPAVAAVVADGSGLNETGSRRMQLAAEAGGALGLLARPPWECAEPSWAATRWKVAPCFSEVRQPRWRIELVRCKQQPGQREVPRRWVAGWSYEVSNGAGTLDLSAEVGHRTDAASEAGGGIARSA